MPVFVAFAAFMLILYGHHFGLRVPPLPGFEGLFRGTAKVGGPEIRRAHRLLSRWCSIMTAAACRRRLPQGQLAGREFASLREAELLRLLDEIGSADSQGATLLEAYLDRRCKGWRERRSAGASKEKAREARDANGSMSRKEAYDVLDLKPGASEEAIRAAHRRLMMKLHPDRGGSTYLASRINEAKDVLLGRR